MKIRTNQDLPDWVDGLPKKSDSENSITEPFKRAIPYVEEEVEAPEEASSPVPDLVVKQVANYFQKNKDKHFNFPGMGDLDGEKLAIEVLKMTDIGIKVIERIKDKLTVKTPSGKWGRRPRQRSHTPFHKTRSLSPFAQKIRLAERIKHYDYDAIPDQEEGDLVTKDFENWYCKDKLYFAGHKLELTRQMILDNLDVNIWFFDGKKTNWIWSDIDINLYKEAVAPSEKGKKAALDNLSRIRRTSELPDWVDALTAQAQEWGQEVMEPVEFNEPEEGDITTSDHENWYQYDKTYHVGDEASLLDKMDSDQFWPNVWFISDHGNAHLIEDLRNKVNEEKERIKELAKGFSASLRERTQTDYQEATEVGDDFESEYNPEATKGDLVTSDFEHWYRSGELFYKGAEGEAYKRSNEGSDYAILWFFNVEDGELELID